MKRVCLKLLDLKLDNDQKCFMSSRQLLLKILIDYYSYHLDGLEDQNHWMF
jgi:DNA repair protein RecO (recombination protein O)